ncbi:NAD(P)-binding protein [Paraphaeosphaeria sporulosa]|uniref:NAD(P)-binding protein n=1 Tax=Paraphaeosphaeria sporulosa TaxID=1460663 RepID=A0A177CF60_9PLEO|nr:NAD(P)-binding protein [Paraphaeosphaeria sporulosa]OAG05350.1 NAD(P)-binding protein [Paraphaeosphaeria sporulosa]
MHRDIQVTSRFAWKQAAKYGSIKPDIIRADWHAAPIMCGGITLYSPLKKYGAEGKHVGIVGLGRLGHFGVLFAKALGALKITVVSRWRAKEDDAKKLRADHFIAADEEGWEQGDNASSLDLIVSTVLSDKLPLDLFPAFPAVALIMKAVHITGSAIGSPKDIKEMLQLVSEKGIKPWTQEVSLKHTNKAILDFENGKPRYRFVLKNENYSG